MPDASDDQTCWSNLFTGGADPGLEIPDGVWESVMTAALESDTADLVDDLVPGDQVETGFDGLDDERGIFHEFGRASVHGDAIAPTTSAVPIPDRLQTTYTATGPRFSQFRASDEQWPAPRSPRYGRAISKTQHPTGTVRAFAKRRGACRAMHLQHRLDYR